MWVLQDNLATGKVGKDLQGLLSSTSQRARNLPVDLTDEVVDKGPFPSSLGTFSDVWKCAKRGSSPKTHHVAVKVIRIQTDDDSILKKADMLRSKVREWMTLKHEAVLPVLGFVCGFGPLPSPVSPWLDGGNLTRYLKANSDLSLERRLCLLQLIAEGLDYLHSQRILHGDLNGGNILFDTEGTPYIVDYGLLPLILEFRISPYLSTPVGRAVRWVAPDLFQTPPGEDGEKANFTFEGDVYSFGSVMLQVLTGQVPYHYIERDEQVIYTIAQGIRPRRPSPQDIVDEHWNFIQKCWATNPKDRPSTGELVSFFQPQRMTSGDLN
ncbi:kinase-like domain-containing protein [Pisolithus thermaeus]|nr:kinase-like domain-containing protein [Pisolithus thermaeus]